MPISMTLLAGIGIGFLASVAAQKYSSKMDSKDPDDAEPDALDGNTSRGIFGPSSLSAAVSTSTVSHVNFLSDILSRLWPYLKVGGADLIREAVEPMFADVMPGPLKKLKFTKIELGSTPITFDNIVVHELKDGCVQFDWDLLWNSSSDIQLKAGYGIGFGVKSIKLKGRMSFLMKPLTTVIPCIDAIQYTFINPPELELDFTGLANVADFAVIDKTIRTIIQDVLASMMVLPVRMTFKMTEACDLRDIYTPQLGVARLTLQKGRGFENEKRTIGKDDIPDVYCKIRLGPSLPWKTSVVKDSLEPVWTKQIKDFMLSDYDQIIEVEAWDEDNGALDADDYLGTAKVSVSDILLSSNKTKELALKINKKDTGAFVSLSMDIATFSRSHTESLTKQTTADRLAGLITVVITQAFDLPVSKKEAASFVKVTSCEKEYVTGVVTDAPGYDALNPLYDGVFLFPIEGGTTKSIEKDLVKMQLMNQDKLLDTLVLTYDDLINAKGMIKDRKKMGSGASLDIMVTLEGVHSIENSDAVMVLGRPAKEAGAELVAVSIVRGEGFNIKKKRLRKNDIPDVYCNVTFGSSPEVWRTKTVKNSINPEWKDETRQFSMLSANQVVSVDVYDENRKGQDTYLGNARIAVGKILLQGGSVALELMEGKDRNVGATITIECRKF